MAMGVHRFILKVARIWEAHTTNKPVWMVRFNDGSELGPVPFTECEKICRKTRAVAKINFKDI